jgi:hypothetical protein
MRKRMEDGGWRKVKVKEKDKDKTKKEGGGRTEICTWLLILVR